MRREGASRSFEADHACVADITRRSHREKLRALIARHGCELGSQAIASAAVRLEHVDVRGAGGQRLVGRGLRARGVLWRWVRRSSTRRAHARGRRLLREGATRTARRRGGRDDPRGQDLRREPRVPGDSISIRGDSGWRYYYGRIHSTPFRKADEGVTRVRKAPPGERPRCGRVRMGGATTSCARSLDAVASVWRRWWSREERRTHGTTIVRFGSVRFGSVRFGSVRFGSVRFGSVVARQIIRGACVTSVMWSMTGCPDDGSGGAESGFLTDASESGGGESTGVDACAAVEAAVVDCEAEQMDAQEAAQPPGCDDGAIAEGGAAPPGFEWAEPWPGLVIESDPRLVGAWSGIITNAIPAEGEDTSYHVPIHSVHRPTGKFLHFGAAAPVESGEPEYATDKVVWYPPEPCIDPSLGCDDTFDAVPSTAGIEAHVHVNQEGEVPDMRDFNLFCAAHVNLPPRDEDEFDEPRTMTVGGSAPEEVNQGSPEVFLFSEALTDVDPDPATNASWVELGGISNSRWYATATVMADGDVVIPGGTFNAAGGRRCFRPADPEVPEVPSPLLLRDEECGCEHEEGDFFFDFGLCLPAGVCDPDADPEPRLPYDPCFTAEDGLIPGLELAHREGPDDVSFALGGLGFAFGTYPHLFILPDLDNFVTAGTNLGGKLAFVGQEGWSVGSQALLWDPNAPEDVLQPIGGPSCTPGTSSVMYASDKIMKFGGALFGAEGSPQTSRMTEILDLSDDCPMWRRPEGSQMAMPRQHAGGVLLPDGNVFAAGGTLSNQRLGDVDIDPLDDIDDREYTAFTAELFQRDSKSWCRLADVPAPPGADVPILRGYHAQSFLLADGRVYLGASTNFSQATTHHNYQLFAPPYLFRGPRPEVSPDTSHESVYTRNDITAMLAGADAVRFVRDNEVPIGRVTLVKLSSSTHQWDMEQRFVELEWSYTGEDDEVVDIVPPRSTCFATPGYYMLFAISDLGVPSIARYVVVIGECEAASVPANAPVYPSPSPSAVNDLRAQAAPGLRASCGGVGSTLGLGDFRRSLLELCAASGACPTAGEVELEVRFVGTTGQANVESNELLDSLTVEFTNGVPAAFGDIELFVAGTEFSAAVDLGPGDHILAVCGAFGLLSACVDQPLQIDAVLAEDAGADYRAAAIEPRALDLASLAPGPGLALGDDDVVAVPLPSGFEFPYFDEIVDTLWVGSNGGIRVTAGDIPAANVGLPATLAPAIAVYWDDLDPSLGGRVVTWSDRDRFVVAWEDVPVTAGGRIHAQAHLFRDGRIEFHYPAVSSGPSAHGASATIGVQHDGDALEVDGATALLSEHDAIALDRTSCIASPLRLADSTPCSDRPVVEATEVQICAAEGRATFAAPTVPTVCASHPAAIVAGDFLLAGERQPVASDGTVTVFPGEYTVGWEIHEPRFGVARAEQYVTVGERAVQSVTVTQTDDEAVCCRSDQTTTVLTSGNDGPMNACWGVSCCLTLLRQTSRVFAGKLRRGSGHDPTGA
jgi:hypothetical protein